MTANEIDVTLKKNIYNSLASWKKFLEFFLLSLGVGFLVIGIVFFFAYNWDDLSKFAKLGIAEGLIILSTGIAFVYRKNILVRNIILTGSAVLVGVLFAVFGQVYQTGANAYDFFLAWTLFITILVFALNFGPLWFIYIALINVTLYLYFIQVVSGLNMMEYNTIIILVNIFILLISSVISKRFNIEIFPSWLQKIMAIIIISIMTFLSEVIIFTESEDRVNWVILVLMILYSLGLYYSFRYKNLFYLILICLSGIFIISGIILEINDSSEALIINSIFVIISVFGVVLLMRSLKKEWNQDE